MSVFGVLVAACALVTVMHGSPLVAAAQLRPERAQGVRYRVQFFVNHRDSCLNGFTE